MEAAATYVGTQLEKQACLDCQMLADSGNREADDELMVCCRLRKVRTNMDLSK